MKRTLTVLLAVFLLLLVGCNTTKNDKSAEPEVPNEEAAKEEAAKATQAATSADMAARQAAGDYSL